MPRMRVYLPTDLQEVVRAEVRRQKRQVASEQYMAELVERVGDPAPRERARAVALAQRISGRTNQKTC